MENENEINDEFDIEINLDLISNGCLSTPVFAMILLIIFIISIATQ